ncbi:hypothetical protein BDZ97DRAFT_2054354 [Flammula alnicola]|nr:hypothetical protein BDZ97DRAFT_2054354 [Flammula alnicola]
MVLKFYGNPRLPNTRRVAVVLHEKKVPFEFHLIGRAKREHKSPEYLMIQPFGKSRAICHYIATEYADQGTPLVPTDLKANALFHQAASIEITRFDVAEKQLLRSLNLPCLTEAVNFQEITLADLYHLLPHAGSNVMETRPNVDRWFKDLSSGPSWLEFENGIKSTA